MKKLLKLILISLLTISITACGDSDKKTSLPTTEITLEIVDPEIENVKYYTDALEYLGFQKIDIEKEYSLEELTVYLIELFGKQDEALYANYQSPYKGLNPDTQNVISYAYANWYLTGITSEDLIYVNSNTANNFVAEVLRLLGYKDYGDIKDFTLGSKMLDEEVEDRQDETLTAIDFATDLGLDFNPDTGKVRGDYFAKALWDILSLKNKDNLTVKEMLEDIDMFTEKEYEDATYLAKGEEIPVPEVEEEHTYSSYETTTTQTQEQSHTSGGSSSQPTGGGGNSGQQDPQTPVTPPTPPTPPEQPTGNEPEAGSHEDETPLVDF